VNNGKNELDIRILWGDLTGVAPFAPFGGMN
jgi:hypothetical protein